MQIQLLFVSLVTLAYAGNICKKVTSFDAVCKKKDMIYMLSANPCYNATAIGVTIIDLKNSSSYHTLILSDMEKPVPIASLPGKGAIVVMHSKPATKEQDYRKAKLHVMMYLVDIATYNKNSSVEMLILDPYFYMFHKQCNKDNRGRDIETGYDRQSICKDGMRTGEYSVFCWVKETGNQMETGIYLILFDVCTIPYAVNILVFLETGDELLKSYTEDKTDYLVYVSQKGKLTNCGLQLKVKSIGDPEYYNIELYHTCNSKSGYTVITNDTFFNELGMICPLANCTLQASNPLLQSCYVPWILNGTDEGLNMLTIHLNTTLDVCKSNVEILFTAFALDGYQMFPFTVSKLLIADHEDDWHDGGNAVVLHLSVPPAVPPSSTDGYLYLDGGAISLYIHEEEEKGLVHILVLRHYPDDSQAVPILHTEYWVNREDVCPVQHNSRTALKVGFSIMSVVIVIIFIAICYACKKYKKRREGVGLPSEIYLAEHELNDVEY